MKRDTALAENARRTMSVTDWYSSSTELAERTA
jgi:hypothetical protein